MEEVKGKIAELVRLIWEYGWTIRTMQPQQEEWMSMVLSSLYTFHRSIQELALAYCER